MGDWLTINLSKLSEIGSERLAVAQRQVALKKRSEDLDRLESGLKSLLEIAIETSGDQRARAKYERICGIVSGGGDPAAKINKTRLLLDILNSHGAEGLDTAAIQKTFASMGVEVSRNYIHTVLSGLRTRRGLVTKQGTLFSLAEKGRELVLKLRGAEVPAPIPKN